MNWPTSQDYNEAIQNPNSSFSDPALKGGAATLNSLGLPVPRSGNFADVYQFKGGDGKMWAVKCFTRKVAGLRERYGKIDEHLAKIKLPFTVAFKYFENGIRIRGQWLPLLKMEWVEGFTLNEFVRSNADKPNCLHALMQMWAKLTTRLREGQLAHADLQHGNVLLVPGGASNKLGLKLIDYDGIWVPALAETHSGEVGHPNFQHPLRIKHRLFNADVDRFPHLVVASALRATLIGGTPLWDKFDNGDNLLYKETDLADPPNSAVFKTLWNLKDDVLCTLVGKMALSAQAPLRKTPWLDDLLLTDSGQRLTKDEERQVMQFLGVTSGRAASKGAVIAPIADEFSDFNFNDDDQGERAPAKKTATLSRARRANPAAEKTRSKLPLYIGGGALAVALIIGGVFALTPRDKKPTEIAKNDADQDAPKVGAPPKKNDAKSNPSVVESLPKKNPAAISPPPVEERAGSLARRETANAEEEPSEVKKLRAGPQLPMVDNDFLKPDNWEGMEGLWTIRGSTIVGKTEQALPISTFFRTKTKYKDFEFTCQVRITDGAGGSGVQIRSVALDAAEDFMVAGPQGDMGYQLWGDLWGYRLGRDGAILNAGFGHQMKKAEFRKFNVKPDDFNDYSIKVVGKRVTIKVNGLVAADQEFPIMAEEGIIALELDKLRPMEVTFKNIALKRLNDIDVSKDQNGIGIVKKAAGAGHDMDRPVEFKAKSAVVSVAAILESSALLYACQGDAVLYGITERGETVELGKHSRPIRAVCCSPDGRRAITAGEDGLLRVWSLDDTVWPNPCTGNANRIKFEQFTFPFDIILWKDAAGIIDEANNRKHIILLGKPGHRVTLGFKKFLEQKPQLGRSLGAALTDQVDVFDHSLIVQIFEGGALVCELKSAKIGWGNRPFVNPSVRPPALSQFKSVHDLKQHTGAVVACAIAPDGERAVSVGADSLLCEWNIKNGTLIRKFAIPNSLAVAYLAPGKSVLLGTSAQSALVVDLQNQKRVKSLAGHQGNVRAVCVTKSGRFGYTAGDDSTVCIWNLATGALVKTLTNHKSPVISLARMRNGEFMASAGSDGRICLWDAERFIGRLGGEFLASDSACTAVFNELSDSLILGTGAGSDGAVKYVRLNIDHEPALATMVPPP